jgi:hypothetical protein
MDYTPRQLQAFLAIVEHREQREMREQLWLHSFAAQGDAKKITEQLKKWEG